MIPKPMDLFIFHLFSISFMDLSFLLKQILNKNDSTFCTMWKQWQLKGNILGKVNGTKICFAVGAAGEMGYWGKGAYCPA